MRPSLQYAPRKGEIMSYTRVIPCLDVKDGRVVKGVRFEGFKDAGDPVELAAYYDREGADELVFLDITASAEGRKTMIDVVRNVAAAVSIPFTVGGGVSDVDSMEALFEAGADKVSINSAAVNNPELIREGAERFGSERIVLAIDARRRHREDGAVWWEVVINGGHKPMGIDAVEWAGRGAALGAGELMLNSIDADGTKDGYDNAFNATVAAVVDVPIIASGGVGTLKHLVDGVIEGKADAVLAASIFHFGEHTIAEAKAYMRAHGIEVRL